MLDEATSALDLPTERRMYEAVADELPGLAFLSVGHRPSLVAFHDHILRLRAEGDHALEAVTESAVAAAAAGGASCDAA